MPSWNADTLLEYFTTSRQLSVERFMLDLLMKRMDEFCQECQRDRLICVMSPLCPKRMLLNVRLLNGATPSEIPKFCYEQSIGNVKRFLQARTVVYEPEDTVISNEDAVDFLFGNKREIMTALKSSTPREATRVIKKGKAPALRLKKSGDLFKRILSDDHLFKEGTFFYEMNDHFLVVWIRGMFLVMDLKNDLTTAIAKNLEITSPAMLEILTTFLSLERGLQVTLDERGPYQTVIHVEIPSAKLQHLGTHMTDTRFDEFITVLHSAFPRVCWNWDPEVQLDIYLTHVTNPNLLAGIERRCVTVSAYRKVIDAIAGIIDQPN
jgi:hypothetical protein